MITNIKTEQRANPGDHFKAAYSKVRKIIISKQKGVITQLNILADATAQSQSLSCDVLP